ncbi:TPA: hypothetical protein QDB26_002253 [Burkholderia vietnamiensis]|uniref:hypothetical protein n=1 Tax=Burkholderia cepacia complex TaxID=87882 RepID=UPI001CF375E4|nr:hypothetical protein [Burkholderia vietnamiensis]MCA8268951.1 hypothetical protein [Burkholderia vietnamiensis]UKV75687.1 hypothetical protein FOC29_30880 [Burkholderia vietnamiensis]HDR8926879.1 hypothetical protein [Burkholderia vietnamiensis]HDR9213536.1 hypothetical protein [Burkholderia vietnamiensis]
MKVKETIYRAGETALILRQFLGAMRSWDDALADMRSGKTDVCGHVLTPAAKHYDGRAWRPVYALSAIKAFIRNVHASTTLAVAKQGPQGFVVEFDDAINWRHQKISTTPALAART